MSALTENIGFGFTTMVEAQRGMTAREADHFLKTGVVPDLSLPPADDDPEVDKRVMTSSQARRVLAGELDLVAAAGGGNFLAQAPHHNELHHYKFNPNQPRDEDGRWTDGGLGGVVDVVKSSAKLSGSAQSTKKAIPAVIYKKHADGTVVAQSGDGSRRMRWVAEPKKFIVEENKDGSWQETATLNKSSAYNDLKNPDKWLTPVDQSTAQDDEDVNTPDTTLQIESDQNDQTSTNNEPPASSQTPELNTSVGQLTEETPTSDKATPLEDKAAVNAPPLKRKDMTGPEREAADAYEYTSAYINGALRGTEPASEQTQAHIDALDAAMEQSKLTEPIVTYRGVDDLSRLFGRTGELVGATATDPVFLSTTAKPGIAAQYFVAGGLASNRPKSALNESAVLRLTVPAGVGAITITGDEDVSEILLQRGLTLRVTGDLGMVESEGKWGQTFNAPMLNVEVVPIATTP